MISWNLRAPILAHCPQCQAAPFDQFLHGQVVRFDWFGLRKKIFAVICWNCKEIVSWE